MKNIITKIIIFCVLWIVGYFVYFSLQPPETMNSNNKKVTSDLTLQVEELQTSLNNYSIQVEELTQAKDNLQQQLNNLINEELENNAETIEELQTQIESLGTSIETLNSQKTELQATITELNTTISNLTEENANKDETISSLNNQITNLNNQIMNYQTQIETLNSQIEELEAQIEELENNTSGELTDLTGTTWKINSTSCIAGYGSYAIDFSINDNYYSAFQFYIGYSYQKSGSPPKYQWIPTENSAGYVGSNEEVPIVNLTFQNGDKLTITGGDDVTNSDLISWLQANATQVISFIIKDKTYYAEPGMTWEEWYLSDYNDVYTPYAGSLMDAGANLIDDIALSDVIVANKNYTTTYQDFRDG